MAYVSQQALHRRTLHQGLKGVFFQSGRQQAGRVPHEARHGGGSCGPDGVVLGALPHSDQIGHHLTAGKASRPLACLTADVLYCLHSVVLQPHNTSSPPKEDQLAWSEADRCTKNDNVTRQCDKTMLTPCALMGLFNHLLLWKNSKKICVIRSCTGNLSRRLLPVQLHPHQASASGQQEQWS